MTKTQHTIVGLALGLTAIVAYGFSTNPVINLLFALMFVAGLIILATGKDSEDSNVS